MQGLKRTRHKSVSSLTVCHCLSLLVFLSIACNINLTYVYSVDKGKRKSEVGRAAQKVQAPKPTMKLDLNTNCLDDGYKIHLIMHEFGHALGLLHEHQRSIFWKCIEPHTDLVVMKSHLGNRFADFEEIADSESGPNRTDYDPESIMHYW